MAETTGENRAANKYKRKQIKQQQQGGLLLLREMGKGKRRRTDIELFEVVYGYEELNLVECPLGVLSTRAPGNTKTLRFEDQIEDQSTGEVVTRRWRVSAADSLPGVPTATDVDVLLALFRISSLRADRTAAEVPFTLYQVCRELLWPCDRRYRAIVKDALRQWTGTFIQFENSFRRKNRWVSEKGFNIICWYELTRSDDYDPDEPQKEQLFVWNPKVVESIREKHTKQLDWDFYRRLDSAVSKRLYRFLDKRFHRTDFYMPRLGFVPFCREKVGMSRSYRKPAKYRERLKPAIEELEQKGFLAGVKYLDVNGVPRVQFRKARKRARGQRVDVPESRTLDVPQWAHALQERGVSPGEFLNDSKYADCDVDAIIKYFDFLVRTKSRKVSKNPAGFLAEFIRNWKEWTIPANYEAAKVARRGPVIPLFRAEPGKVDGDGGLAEFRARLNRYSESERIELENEALKDCDSLLRGFVLEARSKGKVGMFHKQLWEQHILKGQAA